MHDGTDEQLIMAFVDGELAPADRRAVERRLESEPGLAGLERVYRESCRLVRVAFAAEAGRPVPEELRRLFAQGRPDEESRMADTVIGLLQFVRRPAYRQVRRFAALAACLMLTVGLTAGAMVARYVDTYPSGTVVRPALLAAGDPGLYRLLDRTPSNEAVAWKGEQAAVSGRLMPLATFQDRAGRYCRQFVQSVGPGDRLFAITCRDASGVWSPMVAMLAPPAISPRPDEYVPAAGAPNTAFTEAADAMMAAPPLDPKAEWLLLRTWSRR